MGITKYLIENPLIKWMILGFLFLTSFFAITEIKRFAYPRVDLNQMTVTAVVPGFSVNEIDVRVTRKINNKLKSIDGIKKFNSTSYPNYAFIFIEIDPDAEVESVKTQIRNEIDSINDFPSEMESAPKVQEIKIDNKPTMVIGITPSDPQNYDPLEFSLLSQELRDKFQNSESISLVYDDIPERQIQILLNKDKMLSYQITFEEVYAMIQRDQVQLSAGNLESEKQVKGMITFSEAQSLDEIENIILRSEGYGLADSPILKVGDIGKVVFALPPPDFIYHINGVPGYKIDLVKKTQADVIEFSRMTEGLIEEFHRLHPEVRIAVHENDSWETEQRLSITLNNGYSSLALIAVILFLFLKPTIAFWAIFEMPVTILLSIILIWMADITINNVSLCGIILTLGIIVDNPTVIGELTMYYQDKGYSPAEASLMGLRQIIKPLIFSLLTTLASFASMFFIPGILGDFAIEIPITVTFMLASSFVESVFILPSHLSHTRPLKFKPWGSRVLDLTKDIYHRTIRAVLKRPMIFSAVTILVIGIAAWQASKGVTFYLFSTEQSNKIIITGKASSDSNLTYTASKVEVIEEVIDNLPQGTVFSYITKVGGGNFNSFRIELILTPFFERELNADQIREILSEEVKKADLNLNTIDYTVDSGGPPSGKPIEINIFHPDEKVRKTVIFEIMNELKVDPIFTEVNSDYEEGMLEIQVKPKPETHFSGIGSDRIAQVLRFAFEGIKVKETEIDNQNTEWILKLDRTSKNFSEPLEGLTVTSPTGITTRLSELMETSEVRNVSEIFGEKGKTKNMISANFNVQEVSSQKLLLDLSERYHSLEHEIPGLEIAYGGEAKESFEVFRKFVLAILGSVVLIYVLLVIQFKNLTQPFLVISSIPFGIAGIIIAFNLQNTNISFLTMIGILGFGGVVVNSSIIMIDFINDLRSNSGGDVDIREIIIEGSLARFRPILITTGSTVVGFLPLAYAMIGETDSIISPMSMGMVWGMLFGTTAALFVVPTLYLLNEQLVSEVRRRLFKKSSN